MLMSTVSSLNINITVRLLIMSRRSTLALKDITFESFVMSKEDSLCFFFFFL